MGNTSLLLPEWRDIYQRHNKMKYLDFSVGDFIKDEYFQTWVFEQGDESVVIFWEGFLAAHPEMRGIIEEASLALKSIRFSEYTLSEDESTKLWNRIHDLESASADAGSHETRNDWYRAAVAAVLVTVVSLVFFGEKTKPGEYIRPPTERPNR